jgi:hypothetical protein
MKVGLLRGGMVQRQLPVALDLRGDVAGGPAAVGPGRLFQGGAALADLFGGQQIGDGQQHGGSGRA